MRSAKSLFVSAFFSASLALTVSPLVPSFAQAAATPEDTVKEIVSKLKESGDPGVVLEYVSWEDAFKDAPPQVLQSLGVKDAGGLKAQTERLMEQPAAFVREKMVQKIATLPPAQQEMMNQQLDSLTKKVEDDFADMKAKLKRTEFKVGKSSVTGDAATVDISATIDGTSQDSELKLLKRNDNWLLASPEFGHKDGKGIPTNGGASKGPAAPAQQNAVPPSAPASAH